MVSVGNTQHHHLRMQLTLIMCQWIGTSRSYSPAQGWFNKALGRRDPNDEGLSAPPPPLPIVRHDDTTVRAQLYEHASRIFQQYMTIVKNNEGKEKNDSNALHVAGRCMIMGLGTPQDLQSGIKLLKRGMELGCRNCMNDLGNLHWRGQLAHYHHIIECVLLPPTRFVLDAVIIGVGLEKSVGLAMQYYERAASLGHVHARHNMSLAYRNGDKKTGLAIDNERAMAMIKQAAEMGDVEAMWSMGTYYR
jgi:TPR repeat protein